MAIFDVLTKWSKNLRKWGPDDIGLEIETEVPPELAYKIPAFSFWTVHADGSLRGFGQEYVVTRPLDINKEFPLALKEFKEKTKGIPFIENSVTTSTHVHLNLMTDEFITLANFLVAYTLVENLLIRYSGPDRRSNLFCLPICDAEETFNNMERMIDAISERRYQNLSFAPDNVKYGAINVGALLLYGSFEIRCFRGTTDIVLIEKWARILHSILVFARRDKMIPSDIIGLYREKEVGILDDIFGEFRNDIRQPDEQNLIEKNFWYAANLGLHISDWSQFNEKPKAKKAKVKDLDNISFQMYRAVFEDLPEDQKRIVLEAANDVPGYDGFATHSGRFDASLLGLSMTDLRGRLANIPLEQPQPLVTPQPSVGRGSRFWRDMSTDEGVEYILREEFGYLPRETVSPGDRGDAVARFLRYRQEEHDNSVNEFGNQAPAPTRRITTLAVNPFIAEARARDLD